MEINLKLSSLNLFKERTEMCDLARECGTDKEQHGYTKVYHDIMIDNKYDNIDILEIGIYFGNSLKLWNRFFTNGKVYAIDNGGVFHQNYNYNKYEATNGSFAHMENDNVKCHLASQKNWMEINTAFNYFNCNMFDYIIDDGSHFQEDQQVSLGLLFPQVKSGGYYIIEDVVDYKDLLNGSWWDQKREDCTDSTDYVISKYLSDGVLKSDYITDDQITYILSNIEDIFLYDQSSRNNSPINGTSKLLVIKKK
jgi:hypothetical protein